jgi:hypothetical protein
VGVTSDGALQSEIARAPEMKMIKQIPKQHSASINKMVMIIGTAGDFLFIYFCEPVNMLFEYTIG